MLWSVVTDVWRAHTDSSFSETTYQTTRRQNSEDHNMDLHHGGNFLSQTKEFIFKKVGHSKDEFFLPFGCNIIVNKQMEASVSFCSNSSRCVRHEISWDFHTIIIDVIIQY